MGDEELRRLERIVIQSNRRNDRRHEANIVRFEQLEQKAAAVGAQMKVIIGLLIANGAINFYGVIHHP